MSKLLAIAAALACLSAGLHHAWIGALVKSYSAFPVGAGMVAGDWTRLAVGAVGQATLLALEMAAPFLVYGIVFNVALGLAARLSPAIQIFFIAQPLNLLLGLALLVVTLGPMISLFTGGMSDWLRGALG